MSDSFDAIVGSFPDLPDCQDPFTERVKEIYRTRERFAHLDRVLRECATSDDPIYRTAAALWEAISGPAIPSHQPRRIECCVRLDGVVGRSESKEE